MLYEDRTNLNENEFNSRRDEMRTKNLDGNEYIYFVLFVSFLNRVEMCGQSLNCFLF